MYRAFGRRLASRFALEGWLAPDAGAPDLTFVCRRGGPAVSPGAVEPPYYVSPHRTDEGESLVSLARAGGGHLLRLAHTADFLIQGDHIVCSPAAGTADHLVRSYLLGIVAALWLELSGAPVLHGSAVTVAGRAVACLSHSGGGKSTLAAALMRRGARLLADDVLALDMQGGPVHCRPAYPAMRLWPDEAGHFVGRYEHLERVDPGQGKRLVPIGEAAFCDEPQLLGAILLPRRREPGTAVRLTELSPRDAVVQLLRYSYAGRAPEFMGLQDRRLGFFATMAQQVPVLRLEYPSGLEHLEAVCQAVERLPA